MRVYWFYWESGLACRCSLALGRQKERAENRGREGVMSHGDYVNTPTTPDTPTPLFLTFFLRGVYSFSSLPRWEKCRLSCIGSGWTALLLLPVPLHVFPPCILPSPVGRSAVPSPSPLWSLSVAGSPSPSCRRAHLTCFSCGALTVCVCVCDASTAAVTCGGQVS